MKRIVAAAVAAALLWTSSGSLCHAAMVRVAPVQTAGIGSLGLSGGAIFAFPASGLPGIGALAAPGLSGLGSALPSAAAAEPVLQTGRTSAVIAGRVSANAVVSSPRAAGRAGAASTRDAGSVLRTFAAQSAGPGAQGRTQAGLGSLLRAMWDGSAAGIGSEADAVNALPGVGESLPAPAKAEEVLGLSPLQKSLLSVPEDAPGTARFLKMWGRLRKSWSSPYTNEELAAAQKEAAAEAGLKLVEGSEVPEVSPEGPHWLNRWAGMLRRTLNVRLYWSPLHNHNGGHGASYNAGGYIISDDLAPLQTRPTTELIHEFLHAFIHRGRHADALSPLRTWFHSDGWQGFPFSKEHPDAGYARSSAFVAEEVLTNLHSAYHRAKTDLAFLERTAGSGASWTPAKASRDIQGLLFSVETVLFLARSIGAMSQGLATGVMQAAQRGLGWGRMEKSFHRMNGSIPYVGEIEENEKKDSAFFRAALGNGPGKVEVTFLSVGRLLAEDPQAAVFPVFFDVGDYSVRVDLDLKGVAKMRLEDPNVQDVIVSAAGRLLAPRLEALRALGALLAPFIDRLAALQARAKQRIDLDLIREIRDESRAAFLKAIHSFIDRPAA